MNRTLGLNGFLPGRASLMLDAIVVTMFFVLMALCGSIYLVRSRRRYEVHKWIQISLASSLMAVLILFEIDIHFIDNWIQRADPSPYFDAETGTGLVAYSLGIHLFFATTTFALWLIVIVRAWRNFPSNPRPTITAASIGVGASSRYSIWC